MAATVSKPKAGLSKKTRGAIADVLDRVGSALTFSVRLLVTTLVKYVSSVLVLALFAALFAMYGTNLIIDAPQTIGTFMASFCSVGSSCNFNEVYGGLGLALFLLTGSTVIIFGALRESGLVNWDLDLLTDKDENLTDVVLEEISNAASPLTAKEITLRTGLERTVVQECLNCLYDDLEIVALFDGVGPTRWKVTPDALPESSDE